MLTAQEEPLSTALPEITLCLDEHYDELSMHTGRFPWVCNFQHYFLMEAQGQLMVITLRANGPLVGYFVGFVKPGLHYQTCLTLTMDVFYIKEEWRNKEMGALKLFRKVERAAKGRGVDMLVMGSKLHMDSSRLFKALGYTPSEMWHTKFLSPGQGPEAEAR